MPGWSRSDSCATNVVFSAVPQLLLITVAPCAAAAFSAANSETSGFDDWTSRILQLGHTALTIWMSSAVSIVQSSVDGGAAGSGDVAPFWLSTVRHPFARVHAGSPNCARYVPRSVSTLG